MASTHSNWMDLGLSKEVEERLRKGAELYRVTYLDNIDTVFEIAACIEILRTANYGTGVQGSFADALVQYGFTNRDGGPIDKSIRSNYKALLDHEEDVRAWWNSKRAHEKRDWDSARAIYRNWQASKKPPPTEAEKAAAKTKKIEAAQRLLGLKPGAPIPVAADWVPAGIGAAPPKPPVEAMAARMAANAEEEAAAAEEGIDYIDALTSINAVKNETTPADFAAALREFAENDAAKIAGLEGNIDGLLVFFDQVKAALAAPPPKPKKARAKKGNKSAGKAASASIAEPGLPKAEPAAAVATIEGASPFVEVAQKYAPPGYTFAYHKAIRGRHYDERKLIETCKPVTARSLYIFLHECAHAHLAHGHNGNVPRHVEEMQAEQYAHKAMDEAGIAVPPEMTMGAKRYVAWKIVQAERRGAKHIDPEALAFAGPDLIAEMHAKYEERYGPRGHSRIKFRRR